ncbi:hypothetical protein MFIFM68171_08758 [Madurella fahalii]|uniref:Uncharacterized protein n=1 Tax=Madurella fahalii TaxID=1157608 RepID=A0ABQ0GL94_9PEZI
MAAKMDVVALFTQMQDTLSTINNTLASLNNSDHDAKLDELEQKRDDAIRALCAAFTAESESLDRKRKAEREEIAARRRKEDEELAARDLKEDEERSGKFKLDTDVIEQDTDYLMSQVEEEARVAIEEGRERLKDLEARRRELNRLIEEKFEVSLPAVPTRLRRAARTNGLPLAIATGTKALEPLDTTAAANSPDAKQNKSAREVHGAMQAAARTDGPTPVHPLDMGTTTVDSMIDDIDHGFHEHAIVESPITLQKDQAVRREQYVAPAHGSTANMTTPEGLWRPIPEFPAEPVLGSAPHNPDFSWSHQPSAAVAEGDVDQGQPGPFPEEADMDGKAAAGEYRAKDIPGTTSHEVHSPGKEEPKLPLGLAAAPVEAIVSSVANNTEPEESHSSKDVSETASKPPSQDEGSEGRSYDALLAAKVPSLAIIGDGTSAVADGIPLLMVKHGQPQHQPEALTMTSTINTTPGHGESSSVSSPGDVGGFGLTAPSALDDTCFPPDRHVDREDNQGVVLSYSGERYIENGDSSHVEPTGADLPHTATTDPDKAGRKMSENDAMVEDAELDEDTPHQFGQSQISGASPEYRSGRQLESQGVGHDGSQATDKAVTPIQGPPSTASPVQDPKVYESGIESESEHEINLAKQEMPKLQAADHTLTSPREPSSFTSLEQEATAVCSDTDAISEHESDLDEQDVLKLQELPNTDVEAVAMDSSQDESGSLSIRGTLSDRESDVSEERERHAAHVSSDERLSDNPSDNVPSEPDDEMHWHEDRRLERQDSFEACGSPTTAARDNAPPGPQDGAYRHRQHEPEGPSLPVAQDAYNVCPHPSSGDENTDAESPPFVTPMATGSLESPTLGQDQTDMDYSFDHGEPVERLPHRESNTPYYGLEDQYTATVYGEDNLFEDDEESEGSVSEEIDSSPQKPLIWQSEPKEHPPTVEMKTAGDDLEERISSPTLGVPRYSNDMFRGKSWVEEVDSYFNEEGEHEAMPETPPSHASQTIPGPKPVETSPAELRQERSYSASSGGLAASRHNPDRPQTPTQRQSTVSPEDVTSDNSASRDIADAADVGWTPQSLRSQATLSSASASPVQATPRMHAGEHDPVIRNSLATDSPSYGGRSRSNSQFAEYTETEGKAPASLVMPWQQEQEQEQQRVLLEPAVDPGHTINANPHRFSGDSAHSSGGSLFQRMRNIFEQPQSNTNTNNRDVGTERPIRSRPSSGTWFPDRVVTSKADVGLAPRRASSVADTADEDGDEHSALLASGTSGH